MTRIPSDWLLPLVLCLPVVAQQPATDTPVATASATKSWRTALEQALFARNYGGDPAAAEQSYAQALALARASGDPEAEKTVRREFAGDGRKRQGKAEQMIGRLLARVSQTPLDKRYTVRRDVQWHVYPRSELARILNRCFDGRVSIGGFDVDLRVDDVLDIADQLPSDSYGEVLRLGMQKADPYVRIRVVDRMDDEAHLDMLVAACADRSRQVREEACEKVASWVRDDESGRRLAQLPVFLSAFDLQTRRAGQFLVQRRVAEQLVRMKSLASDSWWADEIVEEGIWLNTDDGWTRFEVEFVQIVAKWAKTADSNQRQIRLLNALGGWMGGEAQAKGFPTKLAAQLTELALSLDSEFASLPKEQQNLGDLVSSLGTFEDLKRLAPQWAVDPERRRGDWYPLFGMFTQQPTEQRIEVIELAKSITESVQAQLGSGTDHAKQIEDRCAHMWRQCGENPWTDGEAKAYEVAFEAIESIPHAAVRQRMLSSFVSRSRHRGGAKIDAVAAPRWAKLVSDRVGDDSARTHLTQRLIAAKSAHAPAAALALRGKSPRKSGGRPNSVPYGDFLRQAFAHDPDAALKAVLETVRSGWSIKPKVTLGREAFAQRAGGSVRGRDGRMVPIPTRTVINERDRIQPLPSLLCALPGKQAATAVSKLWKDRKQPIPRAELVATLIYAQDQAEALDQLVKVYRDIDGPTKRAEVLDVFRKALHPKARKLVTKALDDKSPLVRGAALAAAEAYLAMDRAKAGLARPAADSEAILFLSGLLKDEDPKVACGAAYGLAATGSIEALPILVRRLKTADEELTAAIQEAIRRLGDR